MTIEAPLHVHGIDGKGQRHLIDASVAARTANSLMNVNAVIEVSELRQVVHAGPFQWLATAKAGAHRGQHRAVSPNLRMTIHADLRGRHARKRRSFNCRVTVTAIQAEAADVMFVAEWNRLRLCYTYIGKVSTAADRHRNP